MPTIFYQAKLLDFYLTFPFYALHGVLLILMKALLPDTSLIVAKYFSSMKFYTREMHLRLVKPWQMAFNSWKIWSRLSAPTLNRTWLEHNRNRYFARKKCFFFQPHIWEKFILRFHTLHFFSCNWLNNCRCKQFMNVLPLSFARSKILWRFSTFQVQIWILR